MAAVTYWVNGDTGDDTNDGSTNLLAFATMDKVTTEISGGTDGDDFTVNVVNSTSYTMDASASTVQIDTLPNSDIVIRGTDSTGALALTSVVAPATGGCSFVFCRETQSTTVKGFDVSFLASTASATAQDFVTFRDADHGPLVIEDCRIRGSALGAALPAGARRIAAAQSGVYGPDLGEIRYCVLENMTGPTLPINGTTVLAVDFHHNVLLYDTTGSTVVNALTVPNLANASNDVRVYNNTVYIETDAAAINAWIDHSASASDQGRMDFYNNVHWYNNTNATPMTSGFVGGGTGGSFGTGTIGYNLFYTGAGITSAEASDSYDAAPWVSPYTGDVEAYEQADTILFSDPSSTYEWGGSGNGYTLTVGKDLRLISQLSSGLSSSVPGALGSGVVIDPDDGGDDFSSDPRYLDVLPIIGTDLVFDLNMRMSTKKNREQRHYVRSDREKVRWREFSTKTINLATNTTQQVIMGGIQTGDVLMLESDIDIQASVGATNQFVPVKVMVLSGGTFTELWIKNTSTTAEANVWIGVVD